MADNAPVNSATSEKVALTLQIDAKVYEAFVRKAQQAGMEIEPFLSNTLTIVLGCRVFNEHYACSPAVHGEKAEAPKKLLKQVDLKELCGS
jgi:hypothetical protein